jgi:hypothetical protein
MLSVRIALVLTSLVLSVGGVIAAQTPELGCLARGSHE